MDSGDFILDPTSQIPDCGDHRDSRTGQEAAALATAIVAKTYPMLAPLAAYGGVFIGSVVDELEQQVGKTGGFLSQLVYDTGKSPRYAACGTVTLVLPPHTKIQGMGLWARELGDQSYSGCIENDGQSRGYKLCSVGYSGWRRNQSGQVIVGTFKNWSHDKPREALLYLSYTSTE